MACLVGGGRTLLWTWLLLCLCLRECRAQRDCTSVDCPELTHCIREVLDHGACCPRCVQAGCACEGYQYYDCLQAGFQGGKVPAGEAYFVDYGSTECSCPAGGGRISCHYISAGCPDVPPNCVELVEPTAAGADGCVQCRRVGCVRGDQTYEAGHSFHLEPCQVCLCPSDGGRLMCYTVPDCDPAQAPQEGEEGEGAGSNDPEHFLQPERVNRLSPNAPLFKPSLLLREGLGEELGEGLGEGLGEELGEGLGEYDYGGEDITEPYPLPVPLSTLAPVSSGGLSSGERLNDVGASPRMELRGRYRAGGHTGALTDYPTAERSAAKPPGSGPQSPALPPLHTYSHTDAPRVGPLGFVLPLHAGSEESQRHPASPQMIAGGFGHPHAASERQTPAKEKPDSSTRPLQPQQGPETHTHPGRAPEAGPERHTHPGRAPEAELHGGLHPATNTDSVADSHIVDTLYYTYEEEEEEADEEEQEPIVTLDNAIDGIDRRNVPYRIKLAQEKTTAEPSTKTPLRPEHLTTLRVWVGPTRNTPSKAGPTMTSPLKYGPTRNTQMNPGPTRTSPLMAGATWKTPLKAGPTTPSKAGPTRNTQMKAETTRNTPLKYGPTRNTQMNPGPTRSSPLKAGPTRNIQMKAGPTRTSPLMAGATWKTPLKAGPTRNTPSKAGPTRNTQMKAETTRNTPLKAGPTRTSQMKDGPTTSSPLKAGPTRTSLLKAGPTRNTPSKAGPTRNTQMKAMPTRSSPLKAGPTRNTPSKVGPTRNTPLKAGPTRITPLRTGGVGQRTEQPDTHHREVLEKMDNGVVRGTPPRQDGGHGLGLTASAEESLESCCVSGQQWATKKLHCNLSPPQDNRPLSTCSIAQKQCCLGSLKETWCASGIASARQGGVCQVDEVEEHCKDDTYQESQACCSCCALGLGVRGAEGRCHAHHVLGGACGHAFLTCCQGHEALGPLRTKEKPPPTSLPRKVSDSRFPNEALSVEEDEEDEEDEEEGPGVLDGPGGAVDGCGLQLCQHGCSSAGDFSYRCYCYRGYELRPDGHTCAVIPEDNRVREDVDVVMPTMSAASVTSSITSAAPPDPCADSAPCSQECTVEGGQARCTCFTGFFLLADGRMCEDVDECVNGGSCRPSQRCVNTPGSFVCERCPSSPSCPPGYRLRAGVCHDVDECAARTHTCAPGSNCENTQGSFRCSWPRQTCLPGFTQDAHANCIDVNECSSLEEPCSAGFSCVNTVGSYACQRKVVVCSQGYQASPDRAKCVDIDECAVGVHRCGGGQICHNIPGSYRCECQTGYQYDGVSKVCTDVNECWRYPGRLCAQTCENTAGSYRCTCTAGFALALDHKNCDDVNECHNTKPCSQECANIYGSYQCYCRKGFHLKEDGHSCEDIDECSQSMGNLCAFQCVNVLGSYQCACPAHGYTMAPNGHTCRDIDECAAASHNCSHGHNCFNIQGGFKCLSLDCPPNYKKESDTRCERQACPDGSPTCPSSPLRITYYQLSFQVGIAIPAQIFRIGPSPAYAGDHITLGVVRGNEEAYFSTRRLNGFTGAVYLQRAVRGPRDFLLDVEMRLLRQGSLISYLARIYVFITATPA